MDYKDSSNVAQTEIDVLRNEPRLEDGRYLRLLADFDNYRRRVERERASAAQSGKRDLLLALLDLVDDFERAIQCINDEPSPIVEGVNSIYRKLRAVLDAEGVAPFNSVGEMFNPDIHEAVGSVSSAEYPPGVVPEEVRRGYRQGDNLLRPARVVVSRS